MNERQESVADNIALAEQLWTHFAWTPALREVWIERLKGLKQHIVRQALKEVRAMYTSREPELKWVLARCGELTAQQHPEPNESRQNATATWHVSWTRTSKHNVPNAWYGCRVQSRAEAEALARQMRGNCCAIDVRDDPYSELETRQEVEHARRVLADLPRERVASMVDRLRSIGFVTQKLPPQFREWPRMAVLTVHAEYLNQQERSNGKKP
jgi:hypothetical protein